jgi:hypothetical protein
MIACLDGSAAEEIRTTAAEVAVPERVSASAESLATLELVSEDAAGAAYVYQTASFEFRSGEKLAGSVMKEIARTFEATRELVGVLPWSIDCRSPAPQERYRAALYPTRDEYIRNGGPENSGGVYSTGDKIFKVPFPSLGLEKRGKSWFRDGNFSNDTLVHEITHQLMHEQIPRMPIWAIEGTAEYTSMLPFRAGTFRTDGHKNAFKEYIGRRMKQGVPDNLGSLARHMGLSHEAWHREALQPMAQRRLYALSALLVYYFSHLDGAGDGARFRAFMAKVAEDIRNRAPYGEFTTLPFRHQALLFDGRSPAELAGQIRAGLRSIGVRVEIAE